MVEQNALIFRDNAAATKIMQIDNPMVMKRMGRLIKRFDQEIWNKHSYNIVHKGNANKFAQNLKLFKALKDTGETTIVETSPYCKVWGISCYSTSSSKKKYLKRFEPFGGNLN